jgi:hypothetical protein
VPEDEPAQITVRKVVAQLRRLPDPTVAVDAAVAEVLVRLYPCPLGGGG